MKILVKAIAGSHLFGTNTETSDQDFKGVFMPSADQIILGNYSDTVRKSTGDDRSRNTKDDVDTELYSLRKFFLMIENGDTAALELLFTPEQFILEKDPVWDEIITIRDTLISKKVNSMIGYARQQASRYGIKGSRMGTLNTAIKILKELEKEHPFKNAKLKHSWDKIEENFKNVANTSLFDLPLDNKNNIVIPAIDIIGKKFSYDTPFSVCIKSLSDTYKKFGQREREAHENEGVDLKACSHAVRVMLQGIELMNTGKLTLPLVGENRELVIGIKTGKLRYKQEIEPLLEGYMEKLENSVKYSNLPERIERSYLDSLILKLYKKQLKGVGDIEC